MNIVTRITTILYSLFFIALLSCGGDNNSPTPTPPVNTSSGVKITIDPTNVKQEMIGFGGALTWYSNWVTASNKKNEIADLMFTDLGIDIIRFKNWYYPDNYPTDKTTTTMSDDGANVAWTATNTLHDLAMERNSDIKILLSSWGPPKSLKSNALLQQGTLKKDDAGKFMYDDFAQYWSDVLDNVPFNPDYISIQNEPTFVTSGWTTCQWAATETTSLPDYTIAFDKVYDKIKTRTTVPVMVGPESQDIPTFAAFGNILKDKASCGAYSYHPYNINSGTSASQVTSSLQSIGSFSTKPSIMTEFSDNLDWFNTALFIHKSLVYANSSGYIYWKLAWATPTSGTDAGMISINSSGQYTVTPFYYLIKHFSKNIDAGYHRIEATSSSTSLNVSAFVSADNKKITLVIINDGSIAIDTDFTATGKTISAVSASQSKVGAYYKSVDAVLGKAISLPAKSITTLVLDI